jgi:hypothetical protein
MFTSLYPFLILMVCSVIGAYVGKFSCKFNKED